MHDRCLFINYTFYSLNPRSNVGRGRRKEEEEEEKEDIRQM